MSGNPTTHAHGTVIAVVGAGGGAGATVLAATLADTAHSTGRKVLLVDGDTLGGGLEFVLGWEDHPGHRWPQLAKHHHPDDIAVALRNAPTHGQLTLLAHDRRHHLHLDATTMAIVLDAARLTHDLIVVDIPRHIDDATRGVLGTADHTLIVTTDQLHTVMAGGHVARTVNAYSPHHRLVIRTTPAGQLTADQIVNSLRLDLAGVVRSEPRLAQRIEQGGMFTNDRGPLVALCRKLTTELCPSTRNAA
ncbi:MAG: septum site-determining protein Ssd [Natronosporangium sp.]